MLPDCLLFRDLFLCIVKVFYMIEKSETQYGEFAIGFSVY